MNQQQPWYGSYPEAAKDFTDSSLKFGHLSELVTQAAQNFGGSPAASTVLPNGSSTTLDYNDVDRFTGDFACYLRRVLGIEAGSVVALMSPNCIGFLIATFGIFKADCICTNINPLYTAPEIRHQLKDSGASVLVIADLFGDKADAAIPGTSVEHVVTISLVDFFPGLKKFFLDFVLRRVRKAIPKIRCNPVRLADALEKGASHRDRSEVDGWTAGVSLDDTALYQYTGGTTGRSKGAELTHANILFNAATSVSLVAETMSPGESDCCIVALPLYHITAFALVMVPSLANGALALMIPSPRPPSNLKAAFENHRVTHFSGINTLFAALLEEPWCSSEVLGHLKISSSGGAAQQVAVAERWKSLTGLDIYQGYGLTECAGCLTLSPYGANRLGSVGVPIPLTTVKIVDEQGEALPPGAAGEVIARGPTIMKGYLNQAEASAETLRDGWLYTGDIGVMDEDGYLRIVDRVKDMILVSGFNVYPNEVEEVIAQLAGVVEVGVIGVPDEKTGEAVQAYVVSSDPGLTDSQILAHCTESLTNYKRPRSVVFIDEIPKSPVGKVLRRDLRNL